MYRNIKNKIIFSLYCCLTLSINHLNAEYNYTKTIDLPDSERLNSFFDNEQKNISNLDLVIKKGWNLISLPYEGVKISMLSDNYPDLTTFWIYTKDTKEWKLYRKTLSRFDFTEVNAFEGFWVYSQKDLRISTLENIRIPFEIIEEENNKIKEEFENYKETSRITLSNEYRDYYVGVVAEKQNTIDNLVDFIENNSLSNGQINDIDDIINGIPTPEEVNPSDDEDIEIDDNETFEEIPETGEEDFTTTIPSPSL